MMSVVYVFWSYVIVFAVVGLMRGWAKELLVAFSVILALTLSTLLKQYAPIIKDFNDASAEWFWIRAIILVALVYFGYQTVALVPHLASKSNRERLQDALFGFFLGAINGYFIAGSLLFYIDQARYPFPDIISAPAGTIASMVATMMTFMPPHLFGIPGIYFAVIIAFIFVIVVYI